MLYRWLVIFCSPLLFQIERRISSLATRDFSKHPNKAPISTSTSSEDALVALITDQLLDDDHVDNLRAPPTGSYTFKSQTTVASLQCWRAALDLLRQGEQQQHNDRNVYSAATFCASLPETHQQRLALEIAHCHMQDVGKAFYKTQTLEVLCTSSDVSAETVQLCMQQLTDLGVNVYTYFTTYIQVLCTRRTQELFLQYYEQVRDNLASSYATVLEQMLDHVNRQAQQNAEQMQEFREQFGEQMKEEMTDILENKLTDVTRVMDQMQQREVESQDRYDDFALYQSSMLLQQAREMERQQKLLEDYANKMQNLSQTVSQTAEGMQPLVSLQSILQVASEGYSWLTFLLHFLVTFNIVWLVSRPERCNPFRTYLYSLVVAEALLELALSGAVRHGWLSEPERATGIAKLRRWAIVVQCVSYTIGFLATFFKFHKRNEEPHDVPLTRLELEQLLNERAGLVQGNEFDTVAPDTSFVHNARTDMPWRYEPSQTETRPSMGRPFDTMPGHHSGLLPTSASLYGSMRLPGDARLSRGAPTLEDHYHDNSSRSSQDARAPTQSRQRSLGKGLNDMPPNAGKAYHRYDNATNLVHGSLGYRYGEMHRQPDFARGGTYYATPKASTLAQPTDGNLVTPAFERAPSHSMKEQNVSQPIAPCAMDEDNPDSDMVDEFLDCNDMLLEDGATNAMETTKNAAAAAAAFTPGSAMDEDKDSTPLKRAAEESPSEEPRAKKHAADASRAK